MILPSFFTFVGIQYKVSFGSEEAYLLRKALLMPECSEGLVVLLSLVCCCDNLYFCVITKDLPRCWQFMGLRRYAQLDTFMAQ